MSKLIFAIPSKGRLKEQCEAYLAEAGLKVKQTGGERGYSAELKGVDGVELRLMSASEIARAVINGEIHLGVTGEDLLREKSPDLERNVHILKPLGFGFARLIVAAPASWIDVDTMSDLDEVGAIHQERTGMRMRVATKYTRQAREFFARKGVGHYRIVESVGATEGAPASGTAELIVDITTTGATLAANGLKIISDGEILASQAVLTAGLRADWSDEAVSAVRMLLDNVEARLRAKANRILRFARPVDKARGDLAEELAALTFMSELEAHCPVGRAVDIAREAARKTGASVSVLEPDFIFESYNDVFEGLKKRI